MDRITWNTGRGRGVEAGVGSLYDPRFEHDGCGVGFVARATGRADHGILVMALEAIARLSHRGAVAADGVSGDGAGVLTQIPRNLLEREAARAGWPLEPGSCFGVGVLFVPGGAEPEAVLERCLSAQDVRVVGWRSVPVDPGALGESARATMPRIRHVLVAPSGSMSEGAFERALYLTRKAFERESPGGYICSLSCRTVVYKALCAARQLPAFYRDLADPAFETAVALFHQRYSTNTLPSWPLAQPFRLAGHNGEINTLWGNRRWMRARARDLPAEVTPVLDPDGSDSASLDEALELLTRSGRDVEHALSMLMVPAWEENGDLPPELAAFYRYHAAVMEPWDGPAAVTFTDGRVVGAALDRNGLRPCRYKVTADGLVVAGSEVGLFDLDEDEVVERGRLGPGQMLVVDLEEGSVLRDPELKARLAGRGPFARWLGARPLLVERSTVRDAAPDAGLQQLYGVTNEDLRYVIGPMAEDGKQATWSMGDDTPVAPLARAPRPLYASLRQRFAQVTNPPIDPLREARVMSLRTWIGPRPDLLDQGAQPPVLEMASPVATADTMRELRRQGDLATTGIDATLASRDEPLPGALGRLCQAAEAAVLDGASLLVVSDRPATPAAPPIPMALALGAVHHHLVAAGLRSRAGLVVEAGDCWDPHHLAVLVGYGAGAVYPWLALAMASSLDPDHGEDRLVSALEGGLRKVMSKMGISTVASYRGAQLFEALGLAPEVVDLCFTGTPNRVGGLGWAELDTMLYARAEASESSAPDARLPDHGLVRFRRDAERHAWSPYTARALQRAVATGRYAEAGPDPEAWDEFRSLARDGTPSNLRDLLETVPAGPGLPVADVEPAEAIARRFVTSAMSLGALSPEAHRTLTLAMNRLGARSNTGEGGEDPAWYDGGGDGVRRDGKIKQIASGRFGVTAEYIARAEELEIKMAQGSKPGEGGQLPGHKVTELIARLRHAQPGISLISPPPHHDIYSIEDLAQLIYDLKRCNPTARVGVKLVAEAGVGTIAAGVAKAYADYVVISGHSGGTGASPLSSIKHAGSPLELGVAETQQVLIRNGLRSRVRLRTDGGLMTGADVVLAALLGAEEFGFGTAPLVAMGCDMARQCHLNTCPTGIATQRPELRAKFAGDPEHVARYFLLIAEEVRSILAGLGLPSLDAAVGRTELLQQTSRAGGLDLSLLLAPSTGDARRCLEERNDRPEPPPLDEHLAREAAEAIEAGTPFRARRVIRNSDRSVGARIAGMVAARHGGPGLPRGTLELDLHGSAGQSLGAFSPPGLTIRLTGEANDYVGKGLSGGELVLRPVGRAAEAPHEHVILGNVALYGATSGRLFAAGVAGERFAVRNSGATAVVEGVGEHGCEYMTGGVVVVLGATGANFGAGMTGGTAFVLDPDGTLADRTNGEFVGVGTARPSELERVRALIEEHVERTGSIHAAGLLADWPATAAVVRKVAPLPPGAATAAAEAAVGTGEDLPGDERLEA